MRSGRLTRLAALATVAVLTGITGAACTRQGGSPAPERPSPAPDTPVVVNAPGLSASLLPADIADEHSARIGALLWRGLTRFDAKGKVVNEVAESIETDDQQLFRVVLQPGWTFSNGEPVTSASFVDAWNHAARPATKALHASVFAQIKGYAAVHPSGAAAPTASALSGLVIQDARRFTIALIAPEPGFAHRLAHLAFSPLPSTAYQTPRVFAARPVGNGPYQLDGPWQPAKQVALRPYARYIGQDPARNGGLIFRVYRDPDAAYADLRAGRLDVLDDIPLSALPTFRDELKLQAINQPVGRTQSLVFPVSLPVWSTPQGRAARQAISLVVERESLSANLFAGTRLPATDLASPVVEGYSRDLCGPVCRLDVPRAQALLAEAGGFAAPVRVAYAADTDDRVWVEAICAGVTAHLAIRCDAAPYPTSAALARAAAGGGLDVVAAATWTMRVPTLGGFVSPRFLIGSPDNDSGYSGRAVQSLLSRAATLPTGADSLPLYLDAERQLLADLPVIPLWHLHATGGSSTAVRGMKMDVFGAPVYTELTRE